MSAPEVRATYNQLNAVAFRFNQSADNIQQMQQNLQQSMARLRTSWQGAGAEAFSREMDSLVMPGVGRLHNALRMAGRTTVKIKSILYAAEEEAARLFQGKDEGSIPPAKTIGDETPPEKNPRTRPVTSGGSIGRDTVSSGGSLGGSGSSKPWGTMAELFNDVVDGNNIQADGSYRPVSIKEIGPNEYVVLIAGTNPTSITGINGWLSAGITGFSPHSAYYNDLYAMINKLPPGATIHLTGHSQGGHNALLLAQDSALQDKYDIANVITWGTSTLHKEYNNESQYHNYLIENDFLGLLHDQGVGTMEFMLNPAFSFVSRLDDVQNTNIPQLQGNPIDSHGQYGIHGNMMAMPLPFDLHQPPIEVDYMELPSTNPYTLEEWAFYTGYTNGRQWRTKLKE